MLARLILFLHVHTTSACNFIKYRTVVRHLTCSRNAPHGIRHCPRHVLAPMGPLSPFHGIYAFKFTVEFTLRHEFDEMSSNTGYRSMHQLLAPR